MDGDKGESPVLALFLSLRSLLFHFLYIKRADVSYVIFYYYRDVTLSYLTIIYLFYGILSTYFCSYTTWLSTMFFVFVFLFLSVYREVLSLCFTCLNIICSKSLHSFDQLNMYLVLLMKYYIEYSVDNCIFYLPFLFYYLNFTG